MDSIEIVPATFPGPVSAAAYGIARLAHRGQFDKVGAQYISHPVRVAARLVTRGWCDEVVAAGYLHDVVEDSDCSLTSLRDAGMPEGTLALVAAMTRLDGQDPQDYYGGLVNVGPAAVAVKEADIDDNTDPARANLLTSGGARMVCRKVREGKVAVGP